jgi:hypothetical protein
MGIQQGKNAQKIHTQTEKNNIHLILPTHPFSHVSNSNDPLLLKYWRGKEMWGRNEEKKKK